MNTNCKALAVLLILMMVFVSDVKAQSGLDNLARSRLDSLANEPLMKETLDRLIVGRLSGLKEMGIIIETLKPDVKQDGLSEKQIQTDVELKLRLAGIKVLSFSDLFVKGATFIYVKVNAAKSLYSSQYVYNIDVDLREAAYLERLNIKKTYAATWEKSMVGTAEETIIAEAIRNKIKGLIDMFINDYLSANPKMESRERSK